MIKTNYQNKLPIGDFVNEYGQPSSIVLSNGALPIKQSPTEGAHANNFVSNLGNNFINDVSVPANSLHATTLDLDAHNPSPTLNPRENVGKNVSEYNALFLFGQCNMTSANDTIAIFCSHNNNDYYKLTTIKPKVHNMTSSPTSLAGAYHFTHMGQLPTRFIKVGNTSGNAITNLKVHFTLMKL